MRPKIRVKNSDQFVSKFLSKIFNQTFVITKIIIIYNTKRWVSKKENGEKKCDITQKNRKQKTLRAMTATYGFGQLTVKKIFSISSTKMASNKNVHVIFHRCHRKKHTRREKHQKNKPQQETNHFQHN